VEELAKLVNQQRELMLELINDHRTELESKIDIKSRKFASRQIDKQYQVNSNFRELANKTVLALEAGEVQRATSVCKKLLEEIDRHGEDLIIADQSPHGWLAVAKVRSNQELPKSVRKKLAQVEKDLASRKAGGTKRKSEQFSRAGAGYSGRRTNQKLSPEEALHTAAKQIRPGLCSHCKKGLHFFRECPSFWQKVQDSRESAVKSSAAATGED
jgi:hypothetical protein